MEEATHKKEYWYVLFVFNGKEHKVAKDFAVRFKGESVSSFVPTKDKVFRGKGKNKIEKELLFPGYVLVESTLTSKEFLRLAVEYVFTSSDIIKILSNSAERSSEIAIKDEERNAWMRLLGHTNNIEISIGFIEKDKVHITHGPLTGIEGVIKKINRHKREATIEIEFMGRLTETKIAVEIMKKSV